VQVLRTVVVLGNTAALDQYLYLLVPAMVQLLDDHAVCVPAMKVLFIVLLEFGFAWYTYLPHDVCVPAMKTPLQYYNSA
jgi:hypothetical protein